MPSETDECPKCGYVRKPVEPVPDWQCPACGVAYVKCRLTAQPISGDAPEESVVAQRMTLESCAAASACLLAALLVARGLAKGVDLRSALLLIPLFICAVSAISGLFGEGLYVWNRWRMGFEIFDAGRRPLLFRLQVVFYSIAVLVFAYFFWAIGPARH